MYCGFRESPCERLPNAQATPLLVWTGNPIFRVWILLAQLAAQSKNVLGMVAL